MYLSDRIPPRLKLSLMAGTKTWSQLSASDRFYYETGARGGSQDPGSFPDYDDPSETLVIRPQDLIYSTDPGDTADTNAATAGDTELYEAYREAWTEPVADTVPDNVPDMDTLPIAPHSPAAPTAAGMLAVSAANQA